MIGRFARSIAGHDKGTLYVIVGESAGRYMMSDGRLKPVCDPKIKNAKHVQIMKAHVSEDTIKLIKECGGGVNEAVKRAIKLYKHEDSNVED